MIGVAPSRKGCFAYGCFICDIVTVTVCCPILCFPILQILPIHLCIRAAQNQSPKNFQVNKSRGGGGGEGGGSVHFTNALSFVLFSFLFLTFVRPYPTPTGIGFHMNALHLWVITLVELPKYVIISSHCLWKPVV